MKKVISVFILIFLVSLLAILISSYKVCPSASIKDVLIKNKVAGIWKPLSARANSHGKQIDLFGTHPNGMLIFTEDLHFTVVLNNPNIPRVKSPDRSKGTPEENKTAIASALGLYGTYTVDKNGSFFDEHVLGSTFRNWNGLRRGRNEITETVKGNKMIENFIPSNGVIIEIVWERMN